MEGAIIVINARIACKYHDHPWDQHSRNDLHSQLEYMIWVPGNFEEHGSTVALQLGGGEMQACVHREWS